MRAVQKTVLSFAMVHIPVGMYSAVDEQGVSFSLLHKHGEGDFGKITTITRCTASCGDVAREEITRGYEVSSGRYIEVTEEDQERVNVDVPPGIRVEGFIDAEKVDLMFIGDGRYFLGAEPTGEKPYGLLLTRLRARRHVAIVRYLMSGRDHLAILRPYGPVLLVQELLWPEYVRSPADVAPPIAEFADQERRLMDLVLDHLSLEAFDPATYPDAHTRRVREMLDAKIAGRAPEARAAPPVPEPSPNFLEALRESVEQTRGRARKPSRRMAPSKRSGVPRRKRASGE